MYKSSPNTKLIHINRHTRVFVVEKRKMPLSRKKWTGHHFTPIPADAVASVSSPSS